MLIMFIMILSMNEIIININFYINCFSWFPCKDILKFWFNTIFKGCLRRSVEININIVDKSIIHKLNKVWREKDSPTNVLTFPFIIPILKSLPMHTDIIICLELLKNESILLKKNIKDYWVYIMIHSFLHLIGYDHTNDKLEKKMIKAEKHFLNILGFNYN